MPWRSFLFWNASGGIIWATLYGVLGYVLGRNIPLLVEILRVLGVGGIVLAVVVILALIAFVVWQRRRLERA